MKRGLAILVALLMAATLSASVDYTAYEKGVTVTEDASSPTGYTAIFVYDELDSYPGLGDIVKVELYSDCFMLFSLDEGVSGFIDPELAHHPSEFRPGLYPAGGNGSTTCYTEMTEFEDGLWGAELPLSSGAFVYNFRVTDSEGNSKSRLDDPSNPTLTNSATGIHSLSSLVYIPYAEDTMGTGLYADRSIELPQPDPAFQGTVETIGYIGDDGTLHGLAVYLPAGYDAEREEPYNVLYLSHGSSGDVYGNELRWMNEGAVRNIMDNLIAEGRIEPFVVVTMNNQQFKWVYSDIEKDQFDYIMPLVESRYNVAAEPAGRAYAGLSAGGVTTSNMLMRHPGEFSYFGIWSAANAEGSNGLDGISSKDVQDKLIAGYNGQRIMLAAGYWDYLLERVRDFGDYLDLLGIPYLNYVVPAAHDWEDWQLVYAYAAENFFWR